MNCPICGADTGAATAFCPNCGSRLEATVSGANSSPFSSPAAPPPAITPPPAAPAAFTPPPTSGSSYGSPYTAADNNVTRPAVNVAPPPAGSPYPPLNNGGNGSNVVSIKSWLGTLLLLMLVPLALMLLAVLLGTLLESVLLVTLLSLLASLSGLIMVFIFAFNKKVNTSKRNFFKATLILALIMIGLGIVAGVLVTIFGVALIDSVDWQNLFSGLEGLNEFDPSMFDPSMFDI